MFESFKNSTKANVEWMNFFFLFSEKREQNKIFDKTMKKRNGTKITWKDTSNINHSFIPTDHNLHYRNSQKLMSSVGGTFGKWKKKEFCLKNFHAKHWWFIDEENELSVICFGIIRQLRMKFFTATLPMHLGVLMILQYFQLLKLFLIIVDSETFII